MGTSPNPSQTPMLANELQNMQPAPQMPASVSGPGVGANFDWHGHYQDYVNQQSAGVGGLAHPMAFDAWKAMNQPINKPKPGQAGFNPQDWGGQFGGPVIQRGATPGYTGPGAYAYNQTGILTNPAALGLPGGDNTPGAGGLGAGLGTGPGAINKFMGMPGYGGNPGGNVPAPASTAAQPTAPTPQQTQNNPMSNATIQALFNSLGGANSQNQNYQGLFSLLHSMGLV